jgi:hypothetical protein
MQKPARGLNGRFSPKPAPRRRTRHKREVEDGQTAPMITPQTVRWRGVDIWIMPIMKATIRRSP